MTMKFSKSFLVCVLLLLPTFALAEWRGVDISLLPEIEANGAVFRNGEGIVEPLPTILGNYGVNLARMHLWVDPPSGRFGLEQTLDLAERMHDAGMDIFLNFHFSDTWVNPSVQGKPAAWENLPFDDLADELQDYTRGVMLDFYDRGIAPAIVQLGNEMQGGILWYATDLASSYASLVSNIEHSNYSFHFRSLAIGPMARFGTFPKNNSLNNGGSSERCCEKRDWDWWKLPTVHRSHFQRLHSIITMEVVGKRHNGSLTDSVN